MLTIIEYINYILLQLSTMIRTIISLKPNKETGMAKIME